jgi:hypothetical protein
VPVLSSFFPFHTRINISIVVFVFCIGLSISMLYLYEMLWRQSLLNDSLFLLSYAATILVLMMYERFYDVPTAFFFLTILILWMKEKYFLSLPLFILSCINRETTILLLSVFLVTLWRKVDYKILIGVGMLQILGYLAIRGIILEKFKYFNGSSIYLRPSENLSI